MSGSLGLGEVALLMAAALSAVWCVVHVVMGGRDVAGPLRHSSALEPIVRDTAWLCWQYVSGTLALLTVLFVLGALIARQYAEVATALSGLFLMIGILVVPAIGQRYGALPQGFLFLPVTVLGLTGLFL
ncbi:hypothetical protein [Thalassococcus sp. S3]|uniref:hypothetical protein n=1 Tax=Thalassococcus sp. S3 TaxID=2017482 RepID=UPI0010240BCC|nr:hypothetical protein [Thalassococcus sp. S3]QBF31552.1 hypothetical protein CFI11_10030 [Thalassococcus sp. S3]